MKFLVSSSSLLKSLIVANGVINSANTLPILDNFLFTISPNLLTISTSDLETSVNITLEIQSQDQGSIAIPAKMLIETLKNFSDQPLTFIVNRDKHLVEINSQQGKYELAFQDGADFPQVPDVVSENSILMNSDAFLGAINHTVFATGNDELRPVMSGVLCEFSPQGSTFVATNAHKLVRYKRADIISSTNSSFILPKKPISILKSVLGGKQSDVQLEFNNTNAKFIFENIVLTCRFVEGKYPNYSAVIPQDNPNKLYIDRNSLLSSVKRVSIFSNKTTNQIRFNLTNNMLELSAEDRDFSNKADEKIPCQFDGDFQIAFNSKFLIELLQNLDCQDMILEMSQPNRAGILIPNDEESNENEDVLMLIMPIMIS
ncbi:MAG: DNA polymerase III subunit beta [Flavobacteriales bacterium]